MSLVLTAGPKRVIFWLTALLCSADALILFDAQGMESPTTADRLMTPATLLTEAGFYA